MDVTLYLKILDGLHIRIHANAIVWPNINVVSMSVSLCWHSDFIVHVSYCFGLQFLVDLDVLLPCSLTKMLL